MDGGRQSLMTAVSRAVGASAKREVLRTPVTGQDGREVSWQAELQWDGNKGKKERLPRHKLIFDWDVR